MEKVSMTFQIPMFIPQTKAAFNILQKSLTAVNGGD